MEPGVRAVARRARVQRRSRSWDRQWGVDPSHLSQPLIRPIRANSELSLTLDPSGDLNLMPWEAARARGSAFRIRRVSIPAHPHGIDYLCLCDPPDRFGRWSAPGEHRWGHRAPESGVGVMPSSPPPSRGGDRPGTSASSAGPSGRPLEERGGLLVSGLKSAAEVKVGREEGSDQRKEGRKSGASKKELNPQNIC